MNEAEYLAEIEQLKLKINYLESMIALMPGHVYWLDKNNVYLGCNNMQAENAGLSSRKEIIGKTNYDMPWRDQADDLNAMNTQVMNTGILHIAEEYAVMNNGNLGIYLSQKVPLRDDNGKIIGMLGVSFDITDRKQAEVELKEAKQKLEQSIKDKDSFIHNMEHDIRTPLGGIYSLVSHLYETESDEKRREFLYDVRNAASELLDYLNSIFEYLQLEAGSFAILMKKFNLQDLINNIYKLQNPAVTQKGLSFTCEYDDNLPAMIISDRMRLHRILINLTSNAIKFTNEGSIKVIVKLGRLLDERKGILKLIVEDSGVGIPPRHLDFIYEKYARVHSSNQGMYKGIGLGLHVVKQFVNDLEGEIEVESEEHKGTRFICILPFQIPLSL